MCNSDFLALIISHSDWGQEQGQAVKVKKLEGKAVKCTSQIRKSQGSSTVIGQLDTKSHQSTIPHLVEQVQSRVKGLFEWRSRPKIEGQNF